MNGHLTNELECRLRKVGNAVYRYTNINNGKIEYVGIVTYGSLPNRHKTHCREEWYKNGTFLFEYIEVATKSEAEAIESHLISLYDSEFLHNKSKVGWGLNSYLPNEYEWIPVIPTVEEIADDMFFKYRFTYESKKYDNIPVSVLKDYYETITYMQRVTLFINQRQ